MKRVVVLFAALSLAAATAMAAAPPDKKGKDKEGDKPEAAGGFFKPDSSTSSGSVSVEGRRIDYQAVAGTLVVHPKAGTTPPRNPKTATTRTKPSPKTPTIRTPKRRCSTSPISSRAQMPGTRPVTFLYQRRPRLIDRVAAHGRVRPAPRGDRTTTRTRRPRPIALVNNDYSLLDASRPRVHRCAGHGLQPHRRQGQGEGVLRRRSGRLRLLPISSRSSCPSTAAGIRRNISSAKATARRAPRCWSTSSRPSDDIDFNGVILLSQILNFDLSPDAPEANPGVDLPYRAGAADLSPPRPGITTSCRLAAGDLRAASQRGRAVRHGRLRAGAARRAPTFPTSSARRSPRSCTTTPGLPVAYIKKADLRVSGGEFEQELQDDDDLTTGRLDTRFSGPTMDPLGKEADYDPQSAAISSAYVSAFNDYVRKDLHYGDGKRLQARRSTSSNIWEFAASAAGRLHGARRSRRGQRHAGPRQRDEVQSRTSRSA